MEDVECPYCDAELEINHDDGFGYDENTLHEMECGECEKNFVFSTSISFYYESFKADCLNNQDHTYELTHTVPRAFSTMRCKDCEETRELTDLERERFGIETKEEYFNNN